MYAWEMAEALGVARQRLYQIVGKVQQEPHAAAAGHVARRAHREPATMHCCAPAQGSADPELAGAVTALERGRAVTKRTARQAVGQ
jgi:hypothetical protein